MGVRLVVNGKLYSSTTSTSSSGGSGSEGSGESSGGGGTGYHPDLTGRDLYDQHPIEAITGLEEKLTEMTYDINNIYGTLAEVQCDPDNMSGMLDRIWERILNDESYDFSFELNTEIKYVKYKINGS